MKAEELRLDRLVMYVPHHAHGDGTHPDCEHGLISSWNIAQTTVFVRYFNRDGSVQSNAKATNLEDLVAVGP